MIFLPANTPTIRSRPVALFITGLCAAAVMLAFPSTLLAHGNPFAVGWDDETNSITVSPTIYRNFSVAEMLVYEEDFGVYTNTGEPGFDRAATLTSGTAISLHVSGPLLYWHPEVAEEDPLPEPQAILEIIGGGVATVSSAGVTGNNPVAIAFLTTHHHVNWELSNVDPTLGLYGITARLVAGQPDIFSASPSDLFLIVLNRGISDVTDYNAGVDRLAEAIPVPEPATVALLAAAAGVGLAGLWRRRPRRT